MSDLFVCQQTRFPEKIAEMGAGHDKDLIYFRKRGQVDNSLGAEFMRRGAGWWGGPEIHHPDPVGADDFFKVLNC